MLHALDVEHQSSGANGTMLQQMIATPVSSTLRYRRRTKNACMPYEIDSNALIHDALKPSDGKLHRAMYQKCLRLASVRTSLNMGGRASFEVSKTSWNAAMLCSFPRCEFCSLDGQVICLLSLVDAFPATKSPCTARLGLTSLL